MNDSDHLPRREVRHPSDPPPLQVEPVPQRPDLTPEQRLARLERMVASMQNYLPMSAYP